MSDRPQVPSLGRSIVTLVTGSMAAQLITLALTPVLSRMYGPNQFGEYAIFVSVSTLVAILGTVRYEMAIVLPRSPREAAGITRLTVRLLTTVAGTLVVIGGVIALLPTSLPADVGVFALLVGPAVFLLGYTSIMNQWFTRSRRYSLLSRNRVLQSGASAAAQIGMGFLMPHTGIGLVLGLIIGQAAAAVFLTVADGAGRQVLTGAAVGGRRWGHLLRKYWRLPVLLTPHTLVDSFRLNGVNLLIGHFSLEAVGQYSQAWRLVQLPAALVGSAISQVYFPRLAAASRAELFPIVRSSVLRSTVLGVAPFAVIMWLSPALFPLVLGAEWSEAGLFAQALVPALFLNLVASPISTVFIVLKKEHFGLIFSLAYTCLSLGTLFVFREDLLRAIWSMGLVQAASLAGYVALALVLAKHAGKGQQ